MKKALLFSFQLIFMWLLSGLPSLAAEREDIHYETLTLRLYYEQKWDSLLVIGEEAINKGYDYYYMRVRVGEAAFYKQRYVRAARHFEKALDFNSFEDYATGFLYKSYHYSNQKNEARLLLARMPKEQALKIGRAEYRPVLYLETGPAFTDQVEKYGESKQTDPGLYSEAYLNRNSQYLLAGIAQPIGNRYLINAAAALLHFTKRRIVNISGLDSLSGDYNVSQLEMYLSPSAILSKSFSISPAFRLVKVNVKVPFTIEDTLVQDLIGPSNELNYNDYAAGGEITYNNPFCVLSLGAWFIHIDKQDLTQVSGTLFLKPFGNLNFYSSTTVSWKKSEFDSAFIITQLFGGKIYRKLWGEIFYTHGDLSYSTEQNIQVIYNAFDKTSGRAGSRLIFNINDYLKLSLRYQVFFREGSELFYAMDGNPGIYSYNYINQSITGGIIWNLH